MNNAAESAKKLTAVLKSVRKSEPPDFPDQDDPVAVLVQSFLLWEAKSDQARSAYGRVRDEVSDFNDLRVSMPHEMIEWLGSRYPAGAERADRLRAALRNIFLREHEVSLARLADEGKREVRKYIESLEGITPYVASRVLVISFDTHAIPVDEQLRTALIAEGIGEPEMDVIEMSAWLCRQIKASDACDAHFALQQWAESRRPKRRTKSKTAGKSGAKGAAGERKSTRSRSSAKTS